MGSAGARRLRDALRTQLPLPVLYVHPKSKTYQPRWTDYVINWGGSQEWPWINHTEKFPWEDATNKLHFFQRVDAHNIVFKNCPINIPEWTTEPVVAAAWNKPFFARTILNGHSGKGIVEHEANPTTVKLAPLYVQYKKKRHEYRVHFGQEGNGTYTIIDTTQKKKRKGFENVNTKIRNHQNGWIYAREDLFIPKDLNTQALNAAFCSGLPFGAVDIIWNEHEDKCYVLEINSAPGIEGTTLQKYVDFFVREITK